MPLFEIGNNELVPFRRVQAGPELYEAEIEGLLWANLEAFTGEAMFPVTTQAQIGDGLRPDIVALDAEGHVVVIEVKRDIDRRQLAQCLEYAGWARSTSLDEIAGMYHAGADQFFPAWMEFTETTSPHLIQRPPRVVLVARDFDARTDGALSFLTDSDLPITVLRVTVYADQEQRRFIDVEADHEAPFVEAERGEKEQVRQRYRIDGRRIEISDLLDGGFLQPGEILTWRRPKLDQSYAATVTDNGQLKIQDGRIFASPSRAATEAGGIPAYDGWHAWVNSNGARLAELRLKLLDSISGE